MPEENKTSPVKKDKGFVSVMGDVASVGFVFAAAVGAGVFIGYKLDKKLNCLPALTIVGVALGMSVGFYNLVKVAKSLEK